MLETTVTTAIDFGQCGVQHGFLNLPYSHDDSAWGSIMIPLTVVQNGVGPTALLTGGNHGDEYEGITSLLKLANALQPEMIQGRVIIVPAMNYPAAENGTRTSPIDMGNMNRSFPGRPDGSMTERIADYFNRYLIPLCDFALDIHSGGRTLDFLPFAASHRLPNEDQEKKCKRGAELFGAPATMVLYELDAASLYDTAVERQGKVFVTTELGGGGTTTPETMKIADCGITNFLEFAGLMEGEAVLPAHSLLLDMPDAGCYVRSEHRGILELTKTLGEPVKTGELLAFVHHLERTGLSPERYYARRDGILAARRNPALTSRGDTIAVIADVKHRSAA